MSVSILSLGLFILATIFGILGYIVYARDILNDAIVPNRWSWLIWSFDMVVSALTYEAISQDLLKSGVFFIGSALCIGITCLIWKRAEWKSPHWIEVVSLLVSIVVLVLWLQFSLTLWAYWLMVAMVPISFIPTWRNSVQNPEHEDTWAWALWLTVDILTLLVVLSRFTDVQELLFIVMEIVCHLTILVLVRRRLK
jgi:hypothetical protein